MAKCSNCDGTGCVLSTFRGIETSEPCVACEGKPTTKKVTFDASVYTRNHGAAPRGRGGWAFVMGARDYDVVDQKDAAGRNIVWFAPGGLTFAEAKKAATVEAKSRGVTFVGVAS